MRDVNVTGTDYSAIPDVSEYIKNGCLVIPEGIEYVLEENCRAREELEELVLPSTMKVIGPVAFAECPNLRKVTLNEGLREIGDGAFLGAVCLTELRLPSTLETVGAMSFYSSGISELVFPESVEYIGEYCCWECPELTRVDVLNPSCVIDEDAFGECPKLVQGYIAPGFSKNDIPTQNLLYSMLWLTSCDTHEARPVMVLSEERRYYTSLHVHQDEHRAEQTVSERARSFIVNNRTVVLERILEAGNTAAMHGIIQYKLFDSETLEKGLRKAVATGQTELASLFLSAKASISEADTSPTADSALSEFEL